MKVYMPDSEYRSLRLHLRRFCRGRYGSFSLAADHYGLSVSAFKKVMQGATSPFEELLADAGVTVRWSLA